jgi:Zn-finger nucleic acid-binding protein
MTCPRCGARLRQRKIADVTVYRCLSCQGSWYDAGKFRLLKRRASHGDYRWIHIDLWKDEDRFRAGKQQRLSCPRDRQPMTTVHYGTSRIHVDICDRCRGIWLDAAEFAKIIRYLEREVDSETLEEYVVDLRRELADAVRHPTRAAEDTGDVAKILHLLELRFIVQHPKISAALRTAGRGIPGI